MDGCEDKAHLVVDAAQPAAAPSQPGEKRTSVGTTKKVADERVNRLLSEIQGVVTSGLDLFAGLGQRSESQQEQNDRRKPHKGVFFQFADQDREVPGQPNASPGCSSESVAEVRGRTGDFMQRLGLMLSSEQAASEIASKLYARFEGDPDRLEKLLENIEDRWGFPERVFPLLRNQLSKARVRSTGSRPPGASESHIPEQEWSTAFKWWLQILKRKLTDVRVSRQWFVQSRKGEDLWKEYLEGVILGKGSYGEVRTALHAALGVARVVKSVPKVQLGLAEDQVEDEVNTLKSLDHPHIVRIFEAFEDQDMLHMVMDYAEGGDLASVIKDMQARGTPLPEVWVCTAARQVVSALEYMHSQGVIHCDLKPGNTMLLKKFSLETADEVHPHVLLADFGLAEIFDGESTAGGKPAVKGTPAYLAPEGFEGRMTHKTDMWALGVMLYEMLTNERPFKGTGNVFMLFCQVANSDPPLDALPAMARDLVRELMRKDPDSRPSATECKDSAWFKETLQQARLSASFSRDALPQHLGHSNYFQRAVMFCMAAGLGASNAPGQDMQGLFQAFQAMDADYSGYLSADELKKGLKLLGIQQHADALMPILDMNQDNSISYTEFLAAAIRMEGEVSERLLRYAFGKIDTDGDGVISMAELCRLLAGGSNSLTLDVLPDGRTVEEVMDEASKGDGAISFEDFREYIYEECKQELEASQLAASKKDSSTLRTEQSGRSHSTGHSSQQPAESPTAHIRTMVDDLDKSDSFNKEVLTAADDLPFPQFHAWLEELFEDTSSGTNFGRFLTFAEKDLEASYVGHYMASTCIQLCLMATGVVFYSVWNVCVSGFRWDPSLAVWDHEVHVAYNTAWFVLFTSGVAVATDCGKWLWDDQRMNRLPASDKDEAAHDVVSMRLEARVCIWGCVAPWISCCFANRFRVAAMFGEDGEQVFSSMNSDYDLIILIIATMVFFSTRTHVRFICCCLMTGSSVLAYISTSVILGVADPRCEDSNYGSNMAWPGIVLVVVCVLSLSGHYAVEYHRRVAFLSLHASYEVLRGAQEEDSDMRSILRGSDHKDPRATSAVKLRRALSIVERFRDSSDLFSKPLRRVLVIMADVLEDTQQEVVKADRLHVAEVCEVLDEAEVTGEARSHLLAAFNALPRDPDVSTSSSYSAGAPSLQRPVPEQVMEAWGWDTLSAARPGTGASAPPAQAARPLWDAAEALLLPAAVEFASEGQAEATRQKAHALVGLLLRHYARALPGAEARAALALHAVRWISCQLGLWRLMEPWERLGMLVSAAGLHCGAASTGETPGATGALVLGDPLLRQAASLARVLAALEASGLAQQASKGGSGAKLSQLVRRLLARLQPQTVLEDVHRVHCALEMADGLPKGNGMQRMASVALVLAAADLAFLALPRAQHSPWATLCQQEATQGLDVAAYLRGLAQTLALPVFKTLDAIGGQQGQLATPLQHLEATSARWGRCSLLGIREPEDVAKATAPGVDPPTLRPHQAALQQPPGGDATDRSKQTSAFSDSGHTDTAAVPDGLLPGSVATSELPGSICSPRQVFA